MINYEKEMREAWAKFAETNKDADWKEIWEASWKQAIDLSRKQNDWQVSYWRSAFDKAMEFFTKK
jgi:hypothetical protein